MHNVWFGFLFVRLFVCLFAVGDFWLVVVVVVAWLLGYLFSFLLCFVFAIRDAAPEKGVRGSLRNSYTFRY